MKHVHTYEPVSHHGVTAELMDLGIRAAEMRKCGTCQKVMPYVQTKKGEWFPLFDEVETDEKDILMA